MTDLPSFPVTGDLSSILGIVTSGELTPTPAAGTITFTSNVLPTDMVKWEDGLYLVPPVPGKISSDGVTYNGGPLRLLANDAGLSVQNLQWQVEISIPAPYGSASATRTLRTFWFDAPTDGGSVDLATVAPVAAAPAQGVTPLTVSQLATLLADGTSTIRSALDALYGGGTADEYHEYANLAAFPGTGVADRVYVALDTGKFYRWSGSAYAQVAGNAATALKLFTARSINGVAFDGTADITVVDATKAQALIPTAVKTGAYTAVAGDLVPADATSGAVPIAITAALADKSRIAVKKIDSSSNAVTLTLGGSDVFNKAGGSTTLTLTLQNQAVVLQYKASGAVWYVVSTDVPFRGVVLDSTNTAQNSKVVHFQLDAFGDLDDIVIS